MFAAVVYDTTNSYQIAFSAFVGCFVLAALLIGLAKPPVHPSVTNVISASDH